MNTNFTTIQAAVDNASGGDTIYIYPSAISYSNATINKRLTIIGPGFNIAENADSTGIETYIYSAKTTTLSFQNDADGSIVTGLDVIGSINLSGISNMFIQRNKISGEVNLNNSLNTLIEGNYFYSTGASEKLDINSGCNAIYVRNNIFDTANRTNVDVISSSVATFSNNIFRYIVTASNCVFKNNIFFNNNVNTLPSSTANIIEFNVFTNPSSFPLSNVTGVSEDSIFVGLLTQGSYSDESKFYLKPNSPAKGAGQNGIDAGVFSGDHPYKLSGIPFVPLVYNIDAPETGSSGTGFPVTIKAKAEN